MPYEQWIVVRGHNQFDDGPSYSLGAPAARRLLNICMGSRTKSRQAAGAPRDDAGRFQRLIVSTR